VRVGDAFGAPSLAGIMSTIGIASAEVFGLPTITVPGELGGIEIVIVVNDDYVELSEQLANVCEYEILPLGFVEIEEIVG